MALAIVLLAGAGVMIRSFLKIQTANMGVNTANVLAGSISLPPARYAGPAQKVSFFDRLETRLEALPGVESVAMGEALPSWNVQRIPYDLDGSSMPRWATDRRPKILAVKISRGYFQTMGATLLSGRDFNDADVASSRPGGDCERTLREQILARTISAGKRLRFFDRRQAPDVEDGGGRRFQYRAERSNAAEVRAFGLLALPARAGGRHVDFRANARSAGEPHHCLPP